MSDAAEPNAANTTSTTSRTAGVADYFAILGVGDRLVWKHSQKQHQQFMLDDEKGAEGMSNDEKKNDSQKREGGRDEEEVEDEEESLLLERFEREVVQVRIVTVYNNHSDVVSSNNDTTNGITALPLDNLSTQEQSQSKDPIPPILTSPTENFHSRCHPPSLPSSPSRSEATSVATLHPQPQQQKDSSILSSKTHVQLDDSSWNIIQTTLPAGRPGEIDPSDSNSPTNQLHHHRHPTNPQHYLPTAPPSEQQQQQKPVTLWPQHHVWDANLDWNTGLQGQIAAACFEQVGLPHHKQPPGNPNDKTAGAALVPLKGLRRKLMESTFRHWRSSKTTPESTSNNGNSAATSAALRPKFYLAHQLRRHGRLGEYQSTPAVAGIELHYVRLHKSCLRPSQYQYFVGPISSDANMMMTTSSSSAAISLPAAATASGLTLLERSSFLFQSQARHPVPEDESTLVELEEYLTLPDNFTEWSIPQEFKFIRDPNSVQKISSSPEEDWKDNDDFQDNQMDHDNSGAAKCRHPRSNRATTTTVLLSHDKDSVVEGYGAFGTDGEGTDGDDDHVGVEAVAADAFEESPDEYTLDPEQLFPRLLNHPSVAESLDASDNFLCIPVVAIRRQRLDDEQRFHETDAAIVDLAVSFVDATGEPVLPDEMNGEDEEEEEDEGTFRILGKTEWTLGSIEQDLPNQYPHLRARPRARLGFPVALARRNLPFGFADAAFATKVQGRFPLGNYKDLPLPEEELPMFCYPTGCRLHRARYCDAPLAEYYGFVVKNERGDSIYVSCVSFMEPLTSKKLSQLAQMSEKRRRTSLPHRRFCEKREQQKNKAFDIRSNGSDVSTDVDSSCLLTGFDDMTTFEAKTICLVSRQPFWTAFRKFLSHLHILSGSSSDLPLERYISHLLLAVPLPSPGGPNVVVPLPALNNDPMVLYLPPEKDFPLVDLPFHRLFACLEIKTVITVVLGLLALERKVIVLSTRPSLVLDVCELLRALLFPFELCAPYVPRLTEPFKSSLDFPGALFVGIHRDGTPNGLAEVVRRNPPEDSIIIDLDTGNIDCDGDRYEVITGAWDLIPSSARLMLVSELETLCRDAGIADGQEPLDSQFDSAFEVALSAAVEDMDVADRSREPLDDRAVRDSFLRFFCAVLGGYERFLVVPDADFLVSGNAWFDAKGFLASVSSERAPFLNALVSTQLFQSFIQRRTEASDVHCLLFDECLVEFHSSPSPYGRLGSDVETAPSGDTQQPQMVYSLLVDQSATLPPNSEFAVLMTNRSMDASEADSIPSAALSKASMNFADVSFKFAETAVNANGDFVTAPSHRGLPFGKRYVYCVDGNPCFPHTLQPDLFLPQEPDSWLVSVSKSQNPLLARGERELEEANRRRRMATSYRGLQNQRRCLWQLPKLMGSHFLGAWLLCIPAQVAQKHVSHDQQTRYLMRALGALRLLRSKQRIVPDEAAYRALMVACGRNRSDRRIELVKLFGLLRSDGIFPSAVTLGQYTRGLAEGYSKRSGDVIQDDDFVGMEVTESASRTGRLGTASMSPRDVESIVSSFDNSIAILEGHGRRWRTRSNGDNAAQKKGRSNKTWLPVAVSSSIYPSSVDRSDNGHSQKLRLIAIWSRTRGCGNCSYVPLDEEIQAGWDVVGGENEIPGSVACPRCGSLVVPMLGYKEMSLVEALNFQSPIRSAGARSFRSAEADFGQLPPQISPKVNDDDNLGISYVAYISPATLRYSLERYVEDHGEEILDRERLRELDPEVYYNFWWYCARFSLPFPLPIYGRNEKQPAHCFAFAAWDRSAAERGCLSAAKVLSPIFDPTNSPREGDPDLDDETHLNSFDEHPLLSRYNLQGFFSTVWDHDDLSKILVKLVEACDKRDFKPIGKCPW